MGRRTSQYSEHFPIVCFASLYAQLDFSHTQLKFLYGQLITFHILNATFFCSTSLFTWSTRLFDGHVVVLLMVLKLKAYQPS